MAALLSTTSTTASSSVPTLPRTQARAIAQGGIETETSRIQSTQGYTPPPVKEDQPTWRVTDYYRDGATDLYPARTISPFPEGPASIRVYGSGSSGGKEKDFIPAYTKFILNGTQEGHQERAQVVETFSDFYVFFYGQKPPIYTYNGFLINSKNINWVADFFYYYENEIRGTKCVENNARLILTYGGRQVEGYILSFAMQTQAETEEGVPVSFQAIITRRNQIGFSDDFGLSRKNGRQEEDATLRKMLEAVAGKKGTGTSDPGTSKAFNEAKYAMNGRLPLAGPIPV